MSERICAGKCNSRWRREQDAYREALETWHRDMAERQEALAKGEDVGPEPERPAEPNLRPWAGDPIWCSTDSTSIRAALVDLDEQMGLVLLAADGYGSLSLQERVASSPEPASPSPAHDTLDDLVDWLGEWEDAYRKSQRLSAKPYRGVSAPALSSAIAWLTTHLDGILAHPEHAEGFGVGVLKWRSILESAAKAKPRRITKPLRCPQCHLATLSQLEGEDRVECRNRDCGANRGGPVVMTVSEYEGLASELLPPKPARRPSAPHQTVQAAPGDDAESRSAGPRGTSEGVRIDPDTMRLVLDHPYREPLTPDEFAALLLPACPNCGEGIAVEYDLQSLPGKEPVAVGARTLPAIPARVVAKPSQWKCAKPCGAGGGA